MQIALVSNPKVNVVRNLHRVDLSVHYCSSGIRQELTKAIDEIILLRTEMNEERAKHDLQMVEIITKVNDFPNHMTDYF